LRKMTCNLRYPTGLCHPVLKCCTTPFLMALLRNMICNLQVIFRKRATNYRALLRKRPIATGLVSYVSLPPCTQVCSSVANRHFFFPRQGTDMNESWHTYEWVMAHTWMRHGTGPTPASLAACHLYEGHDLFAHVTWLIRDLFTCGIWLIRMWDMSHSHVWHDSFISVSRYSNCRLIRDVFSRETWLIHMRDMTHLFVGHDSFIRVSRY